MYYIYYLQKVAHYRQAANGRLNHMWTSPSPMSRCHPRLSMVASGTTMTIRWSGTTGTRTTLWAAERSKGRHAAGCCSKSEGSWWRTGSEIVGVAAALLAAATARHDGGDGGRRRYYYCWRRQSWAPSSRGLLLAARPRSGHRGLGRVTRCRCARACRSPRTVAGRRGSPAATAWRPGSAYLHGKNIWNIACSDICIHHSCMRRHYLAL